MEQRKTPLLDAIVDYTTDRPVYFKIPGHRYEKGISLRWRQWTGDGIFRFDLTEAEGLDDLHEPEGVIREAQELAAEVFHAKKTYFLVIGTTCGNEAMVLASVKEGEKIMVAKGTVLGGFGYTTTGCSEGVYFEVADKYEYFHKQAKFGLHMPLVFGDHIEDVKMLGEVLGMEVVTA